MPTAIQPRTADGRRRAAEHERKVARVAAELRARPRGEPVSLRKRAVSHQVPRPLDARRRDEKIDVSDLDRIIEVDPERRLCIAEPGVTFVDLVDATLPQGLVPIIVPELKTITIGGAVAGCSVESMSFVHGGFHDTCVEYEIITADGDAMACAPEGEGALAFQMMHSSFGTLGVLSRLVFRLVEAKPFVRVRYETYETLADYRDAIQRRFDAPDVDFMDGMIHAPNCYVLSLGEFVDSAPYTNRYDWLKVYYQSTRERKEDYLTTPDYYFRYDNGVTNVHPKSFVGRLLLGKFIHSSQILWIADKLGWLLIPSDRPDVTIDTFVPFDRFEEFMRWYVVDMGHFPLWCVPYRMPRHYEWIHRDYFDGDHPELFLDLAIYGMPQPEGRNLYREIEEKLKEIKGIKPLLSYNYYTEEEFWQLFDRERYESVKAKTDPSGLFRDLYTKTCKVAMGEG